MLAPALPANEQTRHQVLERLDLLSPGREERFDRYARLARNIVDVPISLVSIVGAEQAYLRGRYGIEEETVPRELSFCGHAVLEQGVFYVSDATEDHRFAGNPLVTGEPGIRFYAGCPIFLPEECTAGTLCIVDTKPRQLDPDQLAMLRDLADCLQQELVLEYELDQARKARTAEAA